MALRYTRSTSHSQQVTSEQHHVAASLQPQFDSNKYPYLTEMLGWITHSPKPEAADTVPCESDFEFGLKLILVSLEDLVNKAVADVGD
jgi:hypothetical protein